MTKSITAESDATAFHEAGQAAMACLQRVPFKQVSIVADADSIEHVTLDEWPDWANPESGNYRERAAFDWFQRRVRVDLAGRIAETHFLGRRPRFGTHLDNCNAPDGALQLCREAEETATALLKWLYLNTRDRLTNPLVWPVVEVLAGALIERKRVGARAALALIRTAIRSARERRICQEGALWAALRTDIAVYLGGACGTSSSD